MVVTLRGTLTIRNAKGSVVKVLAFSGKKPDVTLNASFRCSLKKDSTASVRFLR